MNAPLDPQREQVQIPAAAPAPDRYQPTIDGADQPARPAGHPLFPEQLASMASWLFWIAGLTLLNVALPRLGMSVQFLLGMAVTYWLPTKLAGGLLLAAELAVVAVIAALGWLTRRGALWAYVLGGLIYLADAWLALSQHDNLNLIVHLVLLAFMVNGLLRYQKAVRAGRPV